MKTAQNSRYFIADAALNTEESIYALNEQKQKFITRIPMTIKSPKEALISPEPKQLVMIGDGYSGHCKQRWLLVSSEQAIKREAATFYINLDKNLAKEIKVLTQLTKKHLACEIDAQKSMDEFEAQCQLLGFEQTAVRKVPLFTRRGRPKQDAKPTDYRYQIVTTSFTDQEKVKIAKLKVGVFILATNDTEGLN